MIRHTFTAPLYTREIILVDQYDTYKIVLKDKLGQIFEMFDWSLPDTITFKEIVFKRTCINKYNKIALYSEM